LIQVSLTGDLYDDCLPPLVTTTEHLRQLEGICFRRTSTNVLKLVITGEKDGAAGTTEGADWLVLE
jgi:hypothetical protein